MKNEELHDRLDSLLESDDCDFDSLLALCEEIEETLSSEEDGNDY